MEEEGNENDATASAPCGSVALPLLSGSFCVVSDYFHMELFLSFAMDMHFNVLPLHVGLPL